MIKNKKVYMGCGTDTREGFIGCDLRPLPGVAISCPAWELSKHAEELQEIFSRHMLEHLTLAEVDYTLRDWHKALALGGVVHVIVPNIEFHIDQWRRAEWTEEAYAVSRSDARYGHAGFYGWQHECNPRARDYSPSYWDVHKTAFNVENMTFFLGRTGFSEVRIQLYGAHLEAKATA